MNIAILTGATGGLGKEYLTLLKKEKLDEIWIIARREKALIELAEGDKRVIPFPLDLVSDASFEAIKNSLYQKNAKIKYLINNAGFGILGDFAEADLEKNIDCIKLNAESLTRMCGICLPFMSEGSGILNVSSIASFVPNPRLAVYSATKAYVKSFSLSLREELKKRKINVLALCPGPMKTEFLSVAGIVKGASKTFDTLPSTDPKKAAEGSMKALKKGRAVYTPALLFKVYRVLSGLIPHTLFIKFTKA